MQFENVLIARFVPMNTLFSANYFEVSHANLTQNAVI